MRGDIPAGFDGDAQRVDLALIGHVGGMGDHDLADLGFARRQPRLAIAPLLGQYFGDRGFAQRIGALFDGARQVVAQIGDDAAHGAQHARAGRHQHRADANLADQRRAMQRTGPAENHQREVARIVAALDRQQACAAGHILVDDGQDRFRRLLDAKTELFAQPRHCRARAATTSSEARSFSPIGSSGLIRPSTTFASVTVGSVPPLP